VTVLNKIYIKDMMIKKPHTIGIDEPFSRVWEIMQAQRIRHLPVIDECRKVRGIISQRDLYRTVSPRKKVEEEGLFYPKEVLDQFVLRNVMITEIYTLTPNDTLGSVIDLILKKKFGCIPIVDEDGTLAGIVTQIDILRAVAQYFV